VTATELARVGLVGTGRMGTAMGERILAAGHPLTVYNRTPERAKPLLDAGAALADRLQDLPAAADIVVTVLTDDAAVDSVYSGLLEGRVEGTLFVESSTVSGRPVPGWSTRRSPVRRRPRGRVS
jgi:3-hydroxyisobutyrate dehydrogenase-like beta-hydroxyacid dehydrogenase